MRLERLNNYDLGSLASSFGHHFPESIPDFDEAAHELKRFYESVLVSDGPLAMLSTPVDRLWHTHINATEKYIPFCDDVNGAYIHHRTHSPVSPVPGEALVNTVHVYQGRFGDVPDILFREHTPEEVELLKRGLVPQTMLDDLWSGWPGRV